MRDIALVQNNLVCFHNARYLGANFSPGAFDVWMGRPHRIGLPTFRGRSVKRNAEAPTDRRQKVNFPIQLIAKR